MSDMPAASGIAQAALSAVVTRADGTIEHLGIISYQHLDPAEQERVDALLAAGQRVPLSAVFPQAGETQPA